MNAFFLIVTTAAIFLSSCNNNNGKQTQFSHSKQEEVLEDIDAYLQSSANSGFSGVVLIADSSDDVLFHKAYSAKDDNIDTSNAFYIASNTKSLTGLAIVQLQEQGKLSVNDSISKYFSNVPADKRVITIRHLLTHTSGLGNCECAEGIDDKGKIIRNILRFKLKNPVGVKWQYQNSNYHLLAYIIEKTSGLSFRDYVKKNILIPAGMTQTDDWGYENEIKVRMAPVQLDSLKKRPLYNKIYRDNVPWKDLAYHGSGGYFSTSRDLYKLLKALRENKLISSNSVQQSFQPVNSGVIRDKDTALYYGYGWIYTMAGNKQLNVFNTGREDWMMNSRMYLLENGFIIIVWALDKNSDEDAWATVISDKLIKLFQAQ